MQIRRGKQPGPRRIMLYGQHGVGKSTWANEAPSPFFLNVEDGLNDIDCASTPKLNSYADIVSAISWLANNPHEFKTIVLDSFDWAEQFILHEVAVAANKAAYSLIKFGEGTGPAVKKTMFLLDGFGALQKRGMGIILLAHARVVRHENPETSAYDRYEPDLLKAISSTVQEWCDEVLFASFKVFTKVEDAGFGRERAIAIGGKERFIRTSESATAIAKNRLRLPDELPMSWAAYAEHLPRRQAENISGVVVDGSSKNGVS
jgi:hypothetical protein